MSNLYLPTYEMVVEIHDIVLEASGGKAGVHVKSDILRAIERPMTYTAYVDEYDIDTICAVLIDSIARYHGFKDGNKRTALMTAMLTYRINGFHYAATVEMNKDFDELVMWVVRQKPEIAEVEQQLKTLREHHKSNSEQSFKDMILSFIKMRLKKEKK